MKKITLITGILIFLCLQTMFGQQIPSQFWGINHWLPEKYLGPPVINLGGVTDYPIIQQMVKEDGAVVYRIGGNGYDKKGIAIGPDSLTNDYIRAMTKIRNVNLNSKFLVQIPFKSGITPTNANIMVANIKAKFPFDTVYYAIGNEWDAYVDSVGNKLYSNAQISAFIKSFAIQIKKADNRSKIVAPALSYYGATDKFGKKTMDSLFGNSTVKITGIIAGTSSPADGFYYCDVADFHSYGGSYGNLRTLKSSNYNATRNGLIAYAATGLPSELSSLQTLLNNANMSRPLSPLTFAITEMNVCYKNPIVPVVQGVDTTNSTEGIGARSFYAGQAWAQVMADVLASGTNPSNAKTEFVMPWSIHESGGDGDSLDLSMTKGFASSTQKPLPVSTYYHFQLLSQHFHGKFVNGSSNLSPNVTTFASSETGAGFYVMILNRDATLYPFNINFSGGATGTEPLKLSYPASAALSDSATFYNNDTILPNSTVLLQFNCHGKKMMKMVYSLLDAQKDTVPPHLKQIGNVNVDPQMAGCTHTGIGGTINTNTTYSNTTVYITSDINLVGNNTLTFDNSIVVVSPGVKIKSNPNSAIVIKNQTVMFGCDGKQWKGIELNGNYSVGEKLLIDNSYIFNAKTPVIADKIADMKITNSMFVNGQTAISLNRSKEFTITGNTIAGYTTGIQTTNTKAGYNSVIKENNLIQLNTAIDFNKDMHDLLKIACNRIAFSNKGILSRNTTLAQQGDATQSAGNTFLKMSAGVPSDYIDHTGNSTQYFFGPSQAVAFLSPLVMNIPKVQSLADQFCNTAALAPCTAFVGIAENQVKPSEFLIYPNPSSGAFTVKFTDLPKGNWNLTVYDVMGRVISTKKVDPSSESTVLQINSKGLYFVCLQSGDNRVTQKVIVE